MHLIRMHPYGSALFLAALLFVGGAILVASRSPVAPSQNALTWNSGAPISAYQSAEAPAQSPQQIAQEVIQNQALVTLALSPLATSSNSSSRSVSSSSNDYLTLLAELSGNLAPPSSTQPNTAAQTIARAYQFIPTGLVATTAPAKKPMTASQQALYDYGNEVGAEIQAFESLHTNEAQILKDQAEDRTNAAKAAAVVALGQGFASVGTYMNQMQDVPGSAVSLHAALAQSYLDIGAKLQLVAEAQSDANFVQAVEDYDGFANAFVRHYAALAQFFSEQGVTFSQQDPGSVFSFSKQGGF